MGLLGLEARHSYTPPGASEPAITLNRVIDDAGASVFPRYNLRRIGGLHGAAESTAAPTKRVGRSGEIARRSHRGGKTVTYEGVIEAQTRLELREAEQALRDAFQDQSGEGRMDVATHPSFDATGAHDRFYNAMPLAVEIDDVVVSPNRISRGHESNFVVSLRNHDGRYFKELTLAGFKQALLDLGPARFWALDAIDGVNELVAGIDDAVAQGGASVGAGPGLLAGITGDSSTDLDGANDYFTTPYAPFVNGSVRSFLGWARRDSTVNPGALVAGSTALVLPILEVLSDGPANVQWGSAGLAGGGNVPAEWVNAWPDGNPVVAWCLVFDEAANDAKLYIDGVLMDRFTTENDPYDATPGTFQIGAGGAGGVPWNGPQAYVAAFERALTAQEIADTHEWATIGRRAYW